MYLVYLYPMKYWSSIFFVLLGCLLFSCIREEVSAGENIVEPGDVLPDFSAVLNDGSELSTQSLKGKVAVLIFRIARKNYRLFSDYMKNMLRMICYQSGGRRRGGSRLLGEKLSDHTLFGTG